jgi:hypothetical protein
MSDPEAKSIEYARAAEELRQIEQTFEHRRRQDERWFSLRLRMGYASIFLMIGVILLSAYVVFRSDSFPSSAVTAAVFALFGDALGVMFAIWKIVLNPNFAAALAPIGASRSARRPPSRNRTP